MFEKLEGMENLVREYAHLGSLNALGIHKFIYCRSDRDFQGKAGTMKFVLLCENFAVLPPIRAILHSGGYARSAFHPHHSMSSIIGFRVRFLIKPLSRAKSSGQHRGYTQRISNI